jgi:hypothetical protein
MSKVQDILNDQLNDPKSMLNNALHGKPVATADVRLETKTILKLAGGILACGVVLMLIYKFFIQKK